jgi:hypothetical protein
LVNVLRMARLNGWEHIAYVGPFGSEHTWTNPDHRVAVEFVDGVGTNLEVHKRRRRLTVTWEERKAKVSIDSLDEALAVLSALGVLPSPTERAA